MRTSNVRRGRRVIALQNRAEHREEPAVPGIRPRPCRLLPGANRGDSLLTLSRLRAIISRLHKKKPTTNHERNYLSRSGQRLPGLLRFRATPSFHKPPPTASGGRSRRTGEGGPFLSRPLSISDAPQCTCRFATIFIYGFPTAHASTSISLNNRLSRCFKTIDNILMLALNNKRPQLRSAASRSP